MGNLKGVSKAMPNGSEWVQKGGKILTIVSFKGGSNFEVKFKDSPCFNAQVKEIKNGTVRCKTLPEISGVGYLGYGKYSSQTGTVLDPSYEVWSGILKRCYNTKNKSYCRYGAVGVGVDTEWHNFQNFAEWYHRQLEQFPTDQETKFDVDKDLRGGKCYSEENCILLPYKLNNFIQNKTFNSGMGYIKNDRGNPYNKITTTVSLLGKQIYIGLHATQADSDKSYNVAKNYVNRQMAKEYLAIGLITECTANLITQPVNNYTLEDEAALFKRRPTLQGRIDGLFVNKNNLLERCKYKVNNEIY